MKVQRIIVMTLVAMLQAAYAYRNNEAALDLTADVLRSLGRFDHIDLRRHIQRERAGGVHHRRYMHTPLHRSGRHIFSGRSRRPAGWHSKRSGLKHRKRHSKSRKAAYTCAERISRLMKELSDSSKYETKLCNSMDTELSRPMVDQYNECASSPFSEVFEGTAKIDEITGDTKKYRHNNNLRVNDEDGMMMSGSNDNMADRPFHSYTKRFALNDNPNNQNMDPNAPYIYSTWERVPDRKPRPDENDKVKKEEVAMKYWRDHMAYPGKVTYADEFESEEHGRRQPIYEDQEIQSYQDSPHYDS